MFVTILRDLSGKDWNPKQDRAVKGFKQALSFFGKCFLSCLSIAVVLIFWSVVFVKNNLWLFPHRSALFKYY